VCNAQYVVDRTQSVENGGSFQAGGIGVQHKVAARLVNANDDGDPDPRTIVTRRASVYLELNKWFAITNCT
jgi:hypothetical protein